MSPKRSRKPFYNATVTEKDGTGCEVVALFDVEIMAGYVNAMVDKDITAMEFLLGLITIVIRPIPSQENV